jgi:flagellar motor switch/type III secretory pathway protein FliN
VSNETVAGPRRAAHGDVSRLTTRHLPVIHAHQVTNRLYGSPGLRVDGFRWYWEFTRPARAREWIVLAADERRLRLALDGDAIGFETPPLDWRSYSDATRLLAWTVCHEPLLNLVRTLFQCDWLPHEVASHDVAPAPDPVCAGFAMHRGDGVRVTTGVVLLDDPALQRLATCAPYSEPRLESPLRGVRAGLPMVLDEFDIAPAELSALGRGSIVRLDNRTLAGGAARVAIPAADVRLLADVAGMRATVVALAAGSVPQYPPHNHGIHMTHENSPPPLAPAETSRRTSESDCGVAVGTLPVRLTFSAGQITLPFTALADVGPGFVFELGRRLDDQPITVRANDTPIAIGELVVIGDLVGVRITRMLPRP